MEASVATAAIIVATTTSIVATAAATAARAVTATITAAIFQTVITRAKGFSFAAAVGASATIASVIAGHGFQPAGQLLARLGNQFDQIFGQVSILVVEERGGEAQVTHAAGTTDAMNVLLDVRWQVEVDDVLDIRDV